MASRAAALDLSSTCLRLRPDVSIEPLSVDRTFWERLGSGQLGDFRNEYLVITHECAQDWSNWEMHPKGDEVVCLLSGSLVFVLEMGSEERRVPMQEVGQFVLVPKGIWHTAKVAEPTRLLFISAGEGTRHRPLAGS